MTKSNPKSWLMWLLSGVLLLGLLIFIGWLETRMGGQLGQTSQATDDIGGPFTAHDQHGKVITEQTLLGKPTLVFFGYTYCPDVCPTTLTDISNWLKELGPDADKLNVVFITVDPKRDTEAHMAEYLTSFDKRIIGVIPNDEELKHIADVYHVYYKKVGDGKDYLMDHSASIYLMDKNGKFAGMIDYQEDRASAFDKIKMLLQG